MTNPVDAATIAAIRGADQLDDTALAESLKEQGWIAALPAIEDENGVTLVGNRRKRIAASLGIFPIVQTVAFGAGEAADIQRIKVAWSSNHGGIASDAARRKEFAIYLYQQHNWTQEQIGQALGVGQFTVSDYLRGVHGPAINAPPREKLDSLGRRNTGRPKGSGSKAKDTKRARPRRTDTEAERLAAALVLDEGKSQDQAAAIAGLASVQPVKTAIAREEGRREARAEPPIAVSDLPLKAQQKVDLWRRQESDRLRAEIRAEEKAKVRDWWNENLLPDYQRRLNLADQIVAARRGFMPAATFRLIVSCLHSDSRKSVSERKLDEAFDAFNKLRTILVKESEIAAEAGPAIPSTLAEWDAARARTKAKRQSKPGGVSVRPS